MKKALTILLVAASFMTAAQTMTYDSTVYRRDLGNFSSMTTKICRKDSGTIVFTTDSIVVEGKAYAFNHMLFRSDTYFDAVYGKGLNSIRVKNVSMKAVSVEWSNERKVFYNSTLLASK